MNRAFPAFLALAAALVAVPGHGTLVVAVPTSEGWAVCADRRIVDPVRGDQDTLTKVRRFGNLAVVASTGVSVVYGGLRDAGGRATITDTLFDLNEVMAGLGARLRFEDTPQFWNGVSRAVRDRMAASLAGVATSWSGPQEVQSVFFWVKADGTPDRRTLTFDYQDPKNVKASMSANEPVGSAGGAAAFGQPAILSEIVSGTDRRFDDLRRDGEFRRFLIDSQPRVRVNARDADAFARRLIRVASDRTKDLVADGGHIGPTANCLFVGRNGGVREFP